VNHLYTRFAPGGAVVIGGMPVPGAHWLWHIIGAVTLLGAGFALVRLLPREETTRQYAPD
jgi:hypothetical protein